MIRAQVRIRLPADLWVRELSEAFPDATFNLLAGYRADDTALELGEVITDTPEELIAALRSNPAIEQFELLESADRRALSRYESSDTNLYEFVERSTLPVEFPLTARNGWFEFDLTGTRDELNRLRSVLEESGTDYELQSLVSTTDTDSIVTTRQQELLVMAVREGYYEIPRECTLAELAATAGVDKSTASTILRRGEAAVLKWFLTGPETKGRQIR